MAQALLSANALAIGYARPIGYARQALLPPLDLEIHTGQFWCLLGRNGAGKTTLLRTLLGLLPKLSGELTVKENLRLAYLPQRARFDELYSMSARDVVSMGSERGTSFLRRRSKKALAASDLALKQFDLELLERRRYRDLSEGEKQRVLLARAIGAEPELAFFDEPTSAMDSLAERNAYERLNELCQKQHSAVVLVTHDFSLIRKYADHVLFIDDAQGKVHAGPADEILSGGIFRERYGFVMPRAGDE